jgi:hypothetical protein
VCAAQGGNYILITFFAPARSKFVSLQLCVREAEINILITFVAPNAQYICVPAAVREAGNQLIKVVFAFYFSAVFTLAPPCAVHLYAGSHAQGGQSFHSLFYFL